MKTREEVENLKWSWLLDPSWDLEDTEGFDGYREELSAFRKEQEQKWEAERHGRKVERANKVGSWTGIFNINWAQVLRTPDEIEEELKGLDSQIGEVNTHFELAQLVIAREQVRAMLLLVGQVKRIADMLGEKIDRDAGDFE